MVGTTPQHGKWVSCKNYARAYDTFTAEYVSLTGHRKVQVQYSAFPPRIRRATAAITTECDRTARCG